MGSQLQVTSSTKHAALGAIFFLSYFIRTFISCIALEKIIQSFGVDQLALHFALTCGVTLICSWALVLSPKVGPRSAFIITHVALLLAAISIYSIEDAFIKSQLIFYSIVGLGLLIYVTNWHLASFAISPFQAPRVFAIWEN